MCEMQMPLSFFVERLGSENKKSLSHRQTWNNDQFQGKPRFKNKNSRYKIYVVTYCYWHFYISWWDHTRKHCHIYKTTFLFAQLKSWGSGFSKVQVLQLFCGFKESQWKTFLSNVMLTCPTDITSYTKATKWCLSPVLKICIHSLSVFYFYNKWNISICPINLEMKRSS